MRIRQLVALTAAAMALTCAGCSSGPSATDSGVSPQATAWVQKVCAAMRSVQDAGSTQPAIDENDPNAALRGLTGYFGGVVTAVQGARATLKDAGRSPVANADADVVRIDGQLGQVQAAFQTARDKITGVDPADTQAVGTALAAALAPVQQLDVAADPIGEMRRNPAFDTVAKTVPSCSAT